MADLEKGVKAGLIGSLILVPFCGPAGLILAAFAGLVIGSANEDEENSEIPRIHRHSVSRTSGGKLRESRAVEQLLSSLRQENTAVHGLQRKKPERAVQEEGEIKRTTIGQ